MNEWPVQIHVRTIKQPRLDLTYPTVSGLPDYRIQQYVNAMIWNTVQQLLKDQGYYDNPMTTVTATFEVKTNQRGILSLTLINYAFSGGAHGMTVNKSLTFDVQTGKLYSLAELFTPGSDYVRLISDQVAEQIKARDIPLLGTFEGISPNQDYYIADKSLVVYFQLYELAAYVYGILHFPISVYSLQSIVDENGPLGKMLY